VSAPPCQGMQPQQSLFRVEVTSLLTRRCAGQTTQQITPIDLLHNSIDFDAVIDMFENYFWKYFPTYSYMRHMFV
jgi:hypothetical protein